MRGYLKVLRRSMACRAGVVRARADEAGRVLPYQAGDRAQGDGGQVGDGPVEQHRGGYLCAGPVAGGGGEAGDQSEFGDAEAATALEPRLTTAASRSRIDGSTEQIMTQAEAMLAAAAAATSRTCGQVIAPMLAQTLR